MSLAILFIFIIINNVYLIHSSEIIIIPFFSKKNIPAIDDLAYSNLYSFIKIGDPSYDIKTVLSVQHPYFSITQNKLLDNKNDFFSNYNFSKSNTFKNITINDKNIKYTNYDSIAKEKFELNIFNYEKKVRYNITIDDMIFIYNDNIKDIDTYNLNIGFQIINKNKYKEREKYNFIYQLKDRNIIQNYDWCIFFDKGKNNNGSFLYNPNELINAKGELFLGDLPHKYNNKFHKSQLLTTYSVYSSSLFKWALEFSNIYYNTTMKETINISVNEIQLNFNNYVILAPMIYFFNIKRDFFDYFISKNICKIYQGTEYKTFYCEKSKNFNAENLTNFPTLYMEHKEFQYIFEFTYEDLFLEKENKYWFLIALSIFNTDLEEWNMGIIFLRKYSLIFNQDSKTISFYNPNLKIINDINNNINNTIFLKHIFIIIIIFIVIIICSIILIIIRLYICNQYFKLIKEKKTLNHKKKYIDYKEKDNIDINKKNEKKENLLVEMKGVVYH